jgi:hypothetical protein
VGNDWAARRARQPSQTRASLSTAHRVTSSQYLAIAGYRGLKFETFSQTKNHEPWLHTRSACVTCKFDAPFYLPLQADVEVKRSSSAGQWEYWLLLDELPSDACAAWSCGVADGARFCFKKGQGGQGSLTMLPLAGALGPDAGAYGKRVRSGTNIIGTTN